jgi:ParB-like chromosome segregation protein Spo0J
MTEPHIESIPVELLVVDPEFKAREHDDPDHILRLSQSAPQDWPALIVCKRSDGRYTVLDGCHRLAASAHLDNGDGGRRLTAVRLPCQIIGLAEGESEYAAAVAANLGARALPLSRADRKTFAIWLHEARPTLSAREIGRRVGLAGNTVTAALREPTNLVGKKPALPRFLSALLKADSEGQGFLKLGDRRAYVEKCILSSRNPAAVIESLDAWLTPLSEGADRARAKLGDRG